VATPDPCSSKSLGFNAENLDGGIFITWSKDFPGLRANGAKREKNVQQHDLSKMWKAVAAQGVANTSKSL